MNIPQIYRVLASSLEDLQLPYQEFKEKANEYDYLFSGIRSYTNAYSNVNKFAPFLIPDVVSEYLQPLFDSSSYTNSYKSGLKDGQSIVSSANILYNTVEKYITYLRPMVLAESDENSLFVELPTIPDLDELEKTIKELKQALSTPVYDLDGRVEIVKVDSGSIIIELIFLGILANTIVKTVGNLIWAAVVNRNKYIEGNMLVEQVRATKIENDMVELLKQNLEKGLNESREAEAQHILNGLPHEKNNPENLGNYKHSLDMFKLLLDRGAKFSPSVSAPEETKALFPDTNLMHLVTSRLKLLTGGNEDAK